MALVLIDTSAWLFNFAPRVVPEVRERITALCEQNLAATTSPVVFELLQGVRDPEAFHRFHLHLSSLHQFPFTAGDWIRAARWAQGLRSRGLQAKTLDLIIAHKAVEHGLSLLHADGDFDRIAGATALRVESYVRLARVRK